MSLIRDLSTKSVNPPQHCDVKVDIEDSDPSNVFDWTRIPVTSCELWLDKDGPSNLQRTAKVEFPAEWGEQDITQYVNGLQPAGETISETSALQAVDSFNTYDQARVWFRDPDTGEYEISHYGYVGGVGPAAQNGVMKLWVYDPADLMRRIRVSKSFGQPTIAQVIDYALYDDEVGLTNRSVFDDIGTYIGGVQEVAQQKRLEERQEDEIFGDIGDAIASGFNIITSPQTGFSGPLQLQTDEIIADIFDWTKDNLIDPLLTGQKRFQLNRHNMVDVLDWFAAEIGGKWQFEPTPDKPVLFFDNTASRGAERTLFGAEQREDGEISRRRFIEQELVGADTIASVQSAELVFNTRGGDISNFKNRGAFDLVTTLDNRALYDIKPFNSLTLYGETHDPTEYNSRPGPPDAGFRRSAASGAPILSSRFPKVEVTYPPLVERSGGYRYEAPAVESDKVDLDQAKQQAIKEFRSYLEEETEGNMLIKGNPYITPYDYITSIPVCDGTFPNVDLPRMTYEVNRVKHKRAAEERYTTELGVSLVLDETKLEVEAEYVDA